MCEPYFSGSHRAWAQGIADHSAHDIRLVTHAGGFWKWRMQGAALTLAADIDVVVSAWGRPDVVLASDMVHLPALLGFARRSLGGVPFVLYLHENQLTYPMPDNASPDHTYAMTNWLSMAVADHTVFNSEHPRRDLLAELPKFLASFPDHRHTHDLDRVQSATSVLPVGIDLARFTRHRPQHEPPVVVCNHRWEYDKEPGAFFLALDEVAAHGVDFRVIVAGEAFQTVPGVFAHGRAMLGDRVVHFGTASDEDYPRLLAGADVVVSTARHEFFGVAVVEAIAAGALPVLPAGLSYPELVPTDRPFLYHGHDDLVARLRWALTNHDERRAAAAEARAHVERFAWPRVARQYDDMLAATVTGAPTSRPVAPGNRCASSLPAER